MSAATAPRRFLDWPSRNRAVLDHGLAWLRALLAGEDASGTRTAYEAARAAMRATAAPAEIDRISRIFRLAPFDEDCLLLAAAGFIDREIARPIGAVSAGVALALLTGGDAQAWQHGFTRLGPAAPLRYHRLLSLDTATPLLSTALMTDERIARALAGEDDPDSRLGSVRIQLPPSPCPPRQIAAAVALADAMQAAPRPVGIVLGPPRGARLSVAAAAAGRLGLGLIGLRDAALPEPGPARTETMALMAREAMLRGEAILLDVAGPESRAVATSLAAEVDAPLFILVTEPVPETAGLPMVRLPALEPADRVALWREALGPAAARMPDGCERLADQFPLAPATIAAIAANTAADEPRLWAACRDAAGELMGALAERTAPRFGWHDIVLPTTILEQLRAIGFQVRHRAAVHARGGFASRLAGLGVAALFAGPSGTGKTLAAEIIAGELGLDLCRVDLSAVVSKYIGETERNLRSVFDAAEAGGVALFFDEADALFGERSEVRDSHDRYANLEVSYLLQRMERFAGLAILATNMKAHLDAAFLRRLRFVVDFPFPDSVQRRAMWARAFPPQTPTQGLNLDALSRLDVAGGNIAVIAVNAAFLAAADGTPVGMVHVNRAARDEFRKLDKEFRPVGLEGR
jgi:hypothetical protein